MTAIARLTDGIWVGIPLALRRFSTGLAVSSVDGLYLAARPLPGLIGPPLMLFAGFIIGAFHPGFEYVFTEALWVLLFVAAVGAISGALGLYLTAGFVLGDLGVGDHPQWERFGPFDTFNGPAQYGSMLITYALFAMLAVGVPVAAKTFAAEFRMPAQTPRVLRTLVGLGALVIISGLLVWVWTQSAPLLVRPVFVWADFRPTVAAMFTTQEQGAGIVAVAVVATIARGALQAALASPIGTGQSADSDRMTYLENRFRTDERVVPLLSRMPLVLRLLVRAAVLTAVLAGLYAAYWQAVLTFVVLAFAQFITSPLLPLNLGTYARLINKVPRIIRLLIVMVPVYLLGALILPMFLRQESFLPFLVLALVAAVLMTLLSPHAREEETR